MQLQEVLDAAVPGKILLPETPAYEESNSSYFACFESEVKPALIVQPTSVAEVGAILKALSPSLVKQEVHLAIRGTGHTPFAGSANIQNGVTIDMRGLKGIALSEDSQSVTVSVGETWTTLYEELEKHGLTTAGGRVGRVGVGGLVLGGGLSFYSTRRGFACDSVVDFEVVLASGETVHANASERPDLWKALRGGLNNFGIVTSFRMKTFPSGNMWGGITYFMPTAFGQLIDASVDFVQNEEDLDTHLMSSTGYAFGQHVVTCCMYQTQGQENPPSLQRFTSLPDQIEQYGSMRTASHIEFCNELSNFTKDGVRSFYATCTIRPDAPLMKTVHSAWLETLEPLKTAKGLIFSLGFFPLTKVLLHNSKAAGGNAMNIDPEDGPLFIILLNPTWDDPEDDARVQGGVKELVATFRRVAGERGLLHRYIFTNYAEKDEDVFGGYGEESREELKRVSGKYDPEGVFQTGVPGGFKLARSK